MTTISIFAVIISLIVGVTGYFTTNNLFVAIGIALVCVIYYVIFLSPLLKKYYSRLIRVHECYYFINAFLITMSVKSSLNDAYASATAKASKGFQNEMNHMGDLNVTERLLYLRKYFNLSIYKMFINIVNLYLEQGGDILANGKSVISETIRMEEYCTKVDRLGKRKAFEFALLWAMTFVVLLVMRFGIADFYLQMMKNPMFLVLICAFYLVFVVSTHVFVNKFAFLSLKEDVINEKL